MVRHGDYYRQSVRNGTGPDKGEHADTGDGSLFEARDWKYISNLARTALALGTERKGNNVAEATNMQVNVLRSETMRWLASG